MSELQYTLEGGDPPVDHAAPGAQVLGLQQPPVQAVVLQEVGLAVGRRVHVAVVAHRQEGLQRVPHHARHRHGDQAVGVVVLEDVAALAVQQQHGGLQAGAGTYQRMVNFFSPPPLIPFCLQESAF